MQDNPTYGYTDMKHWLKGRACFERYQQVPRESTPAMAWGSWFHFFLTEALHSRLGGTKGKNPHGTPKALTNKTHTECLKLAAKGAEALCESPVFGNAEKLNYELQVIRVMDYYNGRASFDAIATHKDRLYLIDFKTYGGTDPFMTHYETMKYAERCHYDLQMSFYKRVLGEECKPVYWVICWFNKLHPEPIVDIYEPGRYLEKTGDRKLDFAHNNIVSNFKENILYRTGRESVDNTNWQDIMYPYRCGTPNSQKVNYESTSILNGIQGGE